MNNALSSTYSAGHSRRTFIKRSAGTVLAFGLGSSSLFAAACNTQIYSGCDGFAETCAIFNCTAGGNCSYEGQAVPNDGKPRQYGCGKNGEVIET